MDLIQNWNDDRYYCALHFDISLADLDLESRSQVCRKAKTAAPVIELGVMLNTTKLYSLIPV